MLLTTDRVLGILGVIGVFVGIGLALATSARTKAEATIAALCFIISGYSICLLAVFWAFYDDRISLFRGGASLLICAAAFPCMVLASMWASRRYRNDENALGSFDDHNRSQFLKQIQLDWIDPILDQPLYKLARIGLGFDGNPDAVEWPHAAVVRRTSERSSVPLPSGSSISKILDESAGTLLILGAPGAGKTTVLHELAHELIDLARQDPHRPMPAIFNLSSWAVKRPSLDDWLVQQLKARHGLSERMARLWIQNDQVMPLLDGLDEVAPQFRAQCVRSINRFRDGHGLLSMVVSSRSADYEVLTSKLRLRNAIVIKPLAKKDLQLYLKQTGDRLLHLRKAFERDGGLWDLLNTPLMLAVALLAYENRDFNLTSSYNVKERRNQIFAAFIDAVFERSDALAFYKRVETLSWLNWLARALKLHEQTSLYMEDLRVTWLDTPLQRWLFRLGVLAVSGIIGILLGACFGLLWASVSPWWDRQLPHALILGAAYGTLLGAPISITIAALGSFIDLGPIGPISAKAHNIGPQIWPGLRAGLLVALLAFSTFSLLFLVVFGWNGYLSFKLSPLMVLSFSNFNFQLALREGIFLGATFVFLRVFEDETVKTRNKLNQGTLRSAKSGLAMAVFFAAQTLIYTAIKHLDYGISQMVFVGLITGLALGGLFAIRHLTLRVVMWMFGMAPLRYEIFLERAAQAMLLRRAGGGYGFFHRHFMDYCASLPHDPSDNKEVSHDTNLGVHSS